MPAAQIVLSELPHHRLLCFLRLSMFPARCVEKKELKKNGGVWLDRFFFAPHTVGRSSEQKKNKK
jgi:hypothetical protein